jgi:hypothetical protein
LPPDEQSARGRDVGELAAFSQLRWLATRQCSTRDVEAAPVRELANSEIPERHFLDGPMA